MLGDVEEAEDAAQAVSYTHLDVYKRQVHRRNDIRRSWQIDVAEVEGIDAMSLGSPGRRLSLIHI